MRRIFLASAAFFACAAIDSASAADLPPAAPPPAVAPVKAPLPVWSWSGCYVGVNGGGTRAQNRADLSPGGLYLAPPGATPPPNAAGTGDFAADIAALVTRGDAFLSAGDIASARLFYERAADAGDGAAAMRLGATFDPNFLGRVGVRGDPGDPARAASWYRRARDLGDAAAAERLKSLDRPPR